MKIVKFDPVMYSRLQPEIFLNERSLNPIVSLRSLARHLMIRIVGFE